MFADWRLASSRERLNFALVAVLLVVAVLMGGGSRTDVASLPIVYAVAVAVLAAAVVQLDSERLRDVRVPLLLAGAFALVIAVQLVPLPPAIWRGLSGRAATARDLDLIGLGQLWRPASLTPDLTLYALVALLPAVAVLCLAPLVGRLMPAFVVLLLLLCAASAGVGILQVASAVGSFYRMTNEGAAVGLFANRNHQAALLVCALPLLAAWAVAPNSNPAHVRVRLWCAGCAGAAILPLLLITGSRAGLIFGVVTIAAALAIVARVRRGGRRRSIRDVLLAGAIVVILGMVPVIAVLVAARGVALSRLLSADGELRVSNVGLYLRMAKDFFPWGSGFGSFDIVFRGYEPGAMLSQTYLNHAHDEPAELLIEAGLGGLAVMVALVGWVLWRTLAAWRDRRPSSPALAASIVMVVLLSWSLADYPLRTPSLLSVAAVACVLLTRRDGREAGRPGADAATLGKISPIR